MSEDDAVKMPTVAKTYDTYMHYNFGEIFE